MFFSISQKHKDERFPLVHHTGNFKIHLDRGWNQTQIDGNNIFFKGYCDTTAMEDILAEFIVDPTPKYTGNFCVLVISKDRVSISHDVDRSFPLKFYANDLLTNLPSLDGELGDQEHIWADCHVSYKVDGNLSKQYSDTHYGIFTDTLTVEECKSKIRKVLEQKVAGLKQFETPVHVFLSGGIDTTFVYSLLKNYFDDSKIKLVTEEHFETTEFTARSFQNFKHNPLLWCYNQFHHWRSPTVLATGGIGSSVFLRGLGASSVVCAWHGIDLIEELQKVHHCYHKKYFLRDRCQKAIKKQYNNRASLLEQFPTYVDLCKELTNIVTNDHQHWHLENTLSWTPFKDIRILHAILGLSKQDLLKQIMTGFVDIELINEFSPGMCNIISEHKNINQFQNLLKYEPWTRSLDQQTNN